MTNKENYIIDAHSHIGQDYFWRESNLNEYIQLLEKNNIDMGIIMPVPGPTLINDKSKRYFIWKKDELGKIYYSSDFYEKNFYNPYSFENELIYNEIINFQTSIILKFIPLIHPILDKAEYLWEIVERYKPLALKIHGVGCGCGPYEIKKEFIKILQEISLPLIIHTDYCNYPTTEIEFMRKINNPYDWAKFCIDNNLKGYLTHGCRVDLKTLKLVNSVDNLVVGIGPDLKISKEKNRWIDEINDIKYLEILKNNLKTEKIIFDIDYSWNVRKKKYIDFNPLLRISKTFDEKERKKILGGNARKFFEIN